MDREQGIKLMQDLLRRVVDKKASDLFITAGFPPAIKIDGEVRPQSERALTVVIVTHDLAVVAAVCDDVLVMKDGRIVESGEVDRVFREPRHPYTRELLAAAPAEPAERDEAVDDAAGPKEADA